MEELKKVLEEIGAKQAELRECSEKMNEANQEYSKCSDELYLLQEKKRYLETAFLAELAEGSEVEKED